MIITADRLGRTDAAYHTLNGNIKSKYPVVIVSWVDGYEFNEELLNIKEAVLLCYCEYGWNVDITKTGSHIWGVNSDRFPQYYNGEWVKFDNWVKSCDIKVQFKRELLKKDVSERIKPLEYHSIVNEWEVQTKEQFDGRPINVFQYWGRSNEERLRIHAEIWLHSYKKGFQVCDNLYYINGYLTLESGEKWVTLWIPHYQRVDINELLKINNFSKLSLSWGGSGLKCFRSAEAPINSIMVMHNQAKEYAWSFEWDETNCIFVEPKKEIEGIEAALKRTDLYEIYVNGVETAKKYRLPNYINYLENTINIL